MKKYANLAVVYAVLALVGGVFYREFTKFNGFEGVTALGFVHVHYLALGVLFFLALVVLDHLFGLSGLVSKQVAAYQVGLNLTVVMMVVRGVLQVLGACVPAGMDAAISGVAGIGHIILGISLVLVLLKVKAAVSASE